MEHTCIPPRVYKFQAVVHGISPLISRRFLARSDMFLASIHATLQIIIAESDVALHGFRIHGKEYGSARLGGVSFDGDARHAALVALRLHRGLFGPTFPVNAQRIWRRCSSDARSAMSRTRTGSA
jgi:hypothetical protein